MEGIKIYWPDDEDDILMYLINEDALSDWLTPEEDKAWESL